MSSQVTNSMAGDCISSSSVASNDIQFPACNENEPVYMLGKIIHEGEHLEKMDFEELNVALSNFKSIHPFRGVQTPRGIGKRHKKVPNPSHKRSNETNRKTTSLRIRAINAPPLPRRRPNRSDNPKKPHTRPSTLYRELKKNDYYWF